jgi:hypothetical protein
VFGLLKGIGLGIWDLLCCLTTCVWEISHQRNSENPENTEITGMSVNTEEIRLEQSESFAVSKQATSLSAIGLAPIQRVGRGSTTDNLGQDRTFDPEFSLTDEVKNSTRISQSEYIARVPSGLGRHAPDQTGNKETPMIWNIDYSPLLNRPANCKNLASAWRIEEWSDGTYRIAQGFSHEELEYLPDSWAVINKSNLEVISEVPEYFVIEELINLQQGVGENNGAGPRIHEGVRQLNGIFFPQYGLTDNSIFWFYNERDPN